MTKQIISLASRKKLAGAKFTFTFNHRSNDGIINKILISDLNKFKKELLNQGMKSDMKIQLRLIQPKDKKIVKLFFGIVGSPTNPSSFAELVQSNLTRPSAQLRIYGEKTKSLEKGKIYGYSKINIPIAKETLPTKNDQNEVEHLNHSFLPILIDTKLDQQIFQVDINHEDGPRLCINKNLNEGKSPISYFSSNKLLQGVILQSAISEIYKYIYYSDDELDWHNHWKTFFQKNTGSSFPNRNKHEESEDHLDEILKIFTTKFTIMDKANNYILKLAENNDE